MAVAYSNNASTTLSATITNSTTSLSVASGAGALFPSTAGGDYFYITLTNGAGDIEILKVTARSTDTFTVVRAQDGTSARGWSAGDKIELRLTKAMLDDLKGERALAGHTHSGITYSATSAAPSSPVAGDRWLDIDTGIYYTYVNDGDSSAWVQLLSSGPQGPAGATGATGAAGDTGPTGPAGADGTTDISFSISGTLAVSTGAMRYYFDGNYTITNVLASVSTAPTGASVIFDVNKNGTTIFSTQGNRPTIAASGFTDLSSTPDVTTLASGDYITVDIDQIGSSVAGANAVVRIQVVPA